MSVSVTGDLGGKLDVIKGRVKLSAPKEKTQYSLKPTYSVTIQIHVQNKTLKYISGLSVTSMIGKITPIPSKADTEKPIASGQSLSLIHI